MSVHLWRKILAEVILPLNSLTIMSFQLGCNVKTCQFSTRPLAEFCTIKYSLYPIFPGGALGPFLNLS